MVSWFARAFRRLGCDVTVVGAMKDTEAGDGDTFTDWMFEQPEFRFEGRRVPTSNVLAVTGDHDAIVMVDQGDDWSLVNDGKCPFAYVWREGNPGEEPRVHESIGNAPCFVCMLGKGTQWPALSEFMPFAADQFFLGRGLPYENREHGFIYTGRERGVSTNARLAAEFAKLKMTTHMPGYIKGYSAYANQLGAAKTTFVVDSGTYVGSRGLEAMAAGCAVFWDGGAAFDRLGFIPGIDFLPMPVNKVGNDYEPPDEFHMMAAEIANDKDRWIAMSQAANLAIRTAHTYQHRVQRIADVLDIKLTRTVEESMITFKGE
jgi:hypothetical protein